MANAFVCLSEYHRREGTSAALPEELTLHKGAEATFEETVLRIRTNARHHCSQEAAFWAASAGPKWGPKIPFLQALESLDAYAPHFVDTAG